MNPESWGFIGTLVGAIVGASASIFTTKINSKNAIRIQEDIEKNARKERFRNFQRDNLLELQEKLTQAMRLVTKVYLGDLKHFKETMDWESSRLNPELDNEIADSFRELAIKSERIDDNGLRDEIAQLRTKMTECVMAKSYESGQGKLISLIKRFDKLMPKLGEVLRQNY